MIQCRQTEAGYFSRSLFFAVASALVLMFSSSLSLAESSDKAAEKVSENPLSANARLEVSADPKVATVIVDLKLEEPYKAYLERFKLVVEEPTDVKVEPFQLTPIVQFMDTFSKKMKDGIKKNATMTAKVVMPNAESAKSLKLKLTYQACTTEHCLFPKHIVLAPTIATQNKANSVAAQDADTRSPASTAGTDSADGGGSSEFEKAMSKGLISAVLFMFVAGFLTSLTPCIYPMIPITLAILGADRKSVV